MAALVATTARGSTTAATVAGILILGLILALLVVIGISGSTGRWSRGRAHCKARESRLVATVRVLVRCVHGNSKLLLLLLRKLESVDLRRDTTHGAAWREGVDLTQLLWLQETHVHVLLVCCGNLLLLLLEQLNLLLNSQLFHYSKTSKS